jgi:hypothetical protein
MMNKLRTRVALPAVIVGSALAATSASAAAATGPDLSSLTDEVSVDTVITAVLAVAAVMVGIRLAVMGARRVLSTIK